LLVRVSGQPRLHPQFGFSLTVQSLQPSGEGALKKAFELLKATLNREGLFDPGRKRQLPYPPAKIALVTSLESAAYVDFTKILNVRWPFADLEIYDTQVQGEAAPGQIVAGLAAANAEAELADVLVMTRGGGSADDLVAFNDERVVRAIASSRIPTMVAIGHEKDESLSELAADKRASTPSNAAELLVPDRHAELVNIKQLRTFLSQNMQTMITHEKDRVTELGQKFAEQLSSQYRQASQEISRLRQLLAAYNPQLILSHGYALVRKSSGELLRSVNDVQPKDRITAQLTDGQLDAEVKAIHAKLKAS
jgi:exodeoxyribonuclease VII large subunit